MSMPKKIAIIGPESTGKSTLSEGLARALDAPWVPEYARAYLEALDRAYTEADLRLIAAGQLEAEDRAAARADGGLLFCDTDLYVIKVWSEASFGRCDPWILARIADRRYDHYLLTDIDLPWQQDPLREHPEPRMREYFYKQYRDIVIHSGVPWTPISGSGEARLRKGIAAVRALMG